MKFKVGTNSFELAGIFLKVETKNPIFSNCGWLYYLQLLQYM